MISLDSNPVRKHLKMARMNWDRVRVEKMFERAERQVEQGIIPAGKPRRWPTPPPPNKEWTYTLEDRKRMDDAEEIIRSYTGTEKWMLYAQREQAAKGRGKPATP